MLVDYLGNYLDGLLGCFSTSLCKNVIGVLEAANQENLHKNLIKKVKVIARDTQ